MKALTFVTQKGGSGKSTLCISLAVAAREAGHSVCILEMDRQATVSDWLDHRTVEAPEVAQIDAAQLDPVMERLRDSAYDFVFIDTPGVDSPGTLSAIRAADLCIIPCRPTPADLRAFKPTLAAVYRLEKKFAFVLNQTPPRSYRVRDAADGLAVLGILPDVNIVARTDHQDAIGLGLGVTEFNPKGQAACEIRKLWAWIERRTHATGRTGMSKPPKLSLAAIVAAATPPERAALARTGSGLRTAEIVALSAAKPELKPDEAGPAEPKPAATLKQRARQMSVYLEPPVYDQLRDLAYAERTKMHGLMLEALDLLFKQRGSRSIAQLVDSQSR